MAGKRDKSTKPRSNSKVEKSGHEKEITDRIMAFESLESISEDFDDMSIMAIQRFAQRQGLMDRRIKSTTAVCDAIIKKGMDALAGGKMPVDGKVMLAAGSLRAKVRKEIDSGQTTNVNVQVVTPQEISERINKANRLHPYVNPDG